MSKPQEQTYAEIVAIFMHETDRAILLKIDKRDVWIPKSQTGDVITGEFIKDTEITIMLNTWICDKQGINYDPTE